GPRTQRRRARVGARLGEGHRVHGDRALLPRDAPGEPRHGPPAARDRRPRSPPGVLPRRHPHRRAEDPRDGDHRRARAHPARPLRRRRWLRVVLGQSRLVHHDPDDRLPRTARVRPGRRRHRPPGDRTSLRRDRGAREDADAREGVDDPSRRAGRLRGPREPLRGDPLPLARRPARHRPGDARGHGRGGGRRDHGTPPSPPSRRGCAIPPRVDSDGRGQTASEEFSDDLAAVTTRATERRLIEIIRRASTRGAGVRVGIGDDCAVLEPGAGRLVLATTDLLVEDVHFRRRYPTAADLGWKSLAVNLSDVASMGGRPRWALVALACPEDVTMEEAEGFYAGMLELARAHDVAVAGGDTSASPRGWIVNVTLLGEAVRAPVLRSTAKPGDLVAVTGALGRAAAGLAVLERETTPAGVAPAALDQVKAAHLRPRPRVREGQWLGAAGGVTAMID